MSKNLIKSLKDNLPFFEYEVNETSVFVKHEISQYEINFRVIYEKIIKNHFSTTYDQPEEADILFVFKEITEIETFKGDECIELTESQTNQINEILTKHFYN